MKDFDEIKESFKFNSKKVEEYKSESGYKSKLPLIAASVAVATLVTYAAWPRADKNYEPGEILLKLKSNVAVTQTQDLDEGILGVPSLDKLNKKYEVSWAEKVFDTAKEGDASRVYQLELPHDSNIEKIIKEYEADSNVEYAEPDYKITIEDQSKLHFLLGRTKGIVPNDPGFSKQWGLPKINATEAWENQKGDSNVVIAIIDTGVDYNHEDLTDKILRDENGKVVGWNFVKNNDDPMDGNGHGTHCAGIAAASTNNGKGGAGVAWNCKIMPMKGLSDRGAGYAENLADCIVYAADKGADVLSNSWGSRMPSQTIYEAIKYAYGKGVVVVAAAGHSNSSGAHYPSGHPEVISVAATDSKDKKASFSNYGTTVDISAPGVAIYSSIPGDKYASFSGTSMACPHVAGVAAMILSENPELDNKAVKEIIVKGSDEIGDKKIPPRINLFKAVEHSGRTK